MVEVQNTTGKEKPRSKESGQRRRIPFQNTERRPASTGRHHGAVSGVEALDGAEPFPGYGQSDNTWTTAVHVGQSDQCRVARRPDGARTVLFEIPSPHSVKVASDAQRQEGDAACIE